MCDCDFVFTCVCEADCVLVGQACAQLLAELLVLISRYLMSNCLMLVIDVLYHTSGSVKLKAMV